MAKTKKDLEVFLEAIKNSDALNEVVRNLALESLVPKALMSFKEYVNSIYNMEVLLPIQRFRLEGEELRAETVRLDRARKDAHNVAIDNINALARLADQIGAEPLHPALDGEDWRDRRKAANFCASFMWSVIYDEVKLGIDDAIAEMAEKRKAL